MNCPLLFSSQPSRNRDCSLIHLLFDLIQADVKLGDCVAQRCAAEFLHRLRALDTYEDFPVDYRRMFSVYIILTDVRKNVSDITALRDMCQRLKEIDIVNKLKLLLDSYESLSNATSNSYKELNLLSRMLEKFETGSVDEQCEVAELEALSKYAQNTTLNVCCFVIETLSRNMSSETNTSNDVVGRSHHPSIYFHVTYDAKSEHQPRRKDQCELFNNATKAMHVQRTYALRHHSMSTSSHNIEGGNKSAYILLEEQYS